MLNQELRSRGDPGVSRFGRFGRRSRMRDRLFVLAALARLRHQEAVAPMIAKWRQQHPDAFGGAYHADGFAARTTVRWVGQAPAVIVTEIEQSGLAIALDAAATASQAALVAKTQAISQALHDADAADFVVAPNIRTQVIDVTLAVADETASSADALEQTVRELETSAIGTGISRVTEDPFTPDTAQGGTRYLLLFENGRELVEADGSPAITGVYRPDPTLLRPATTSVEERHLSSVPSAIEHTDRLWIDPHGSTVRRDRSGFWTGPHGAEPGVDSFASEGTATDGDVILTSIRVVGHPGLRWLTTPHPECEQYPHAWVPDGLPT